MQLSVYTFKEGQLNRIGEITILYDRVVQISLKKTPTTNKSHNKKTACPFSIKKFSKADLEYREFGLTHCLICSYLKELGFTYLHLKLNTWQRLIITYRNKKFMWQSKEFKTTVLRSVGTYVILATLSTLCTFLILRPWRQRPYKEIQNGSPDKKDKQKNQESGGSKEINNDSTLSTFKINMQRLY